MGWMNPIGRVPLDFTGVRPVHHAMRLWVNGNTYTREPIVNSPTSEIDENRRYSKGEVRITTGEIGTEIKWHPQSPCFTAIFLTCDWLRDAKAPFVLRFDISGWFEEFYPDVQSVVHRLEAILARADRQFPARTFIESVAGDDKHLSPLLLDILGSHEDPGEYAVECVYNDNIGRFEVGHVGSQSLIAKVYGNQTTSAPRQSSGNYSDTVSEAYRQVVETGLPRTDHVLASLRMPNNNIHWVPYHRLIVPVKSTGGRPSVKVVSQFGSVGFKVV